MSWKELLATKLFTNGLGVEKHILLCKLLRYLGKKYFAALKVDDDGGYWETGDASTLAESIGLTNFMFERIGNFFDFVNNTPLPIHASAEDLLKDLSAFAAAAYQVAPYKPVEASKLENSKTAKNESGKKREK